MIPAPLLAKSPWFLRLQAARMREGRPPGWPLKELDQDGPEKLFAECELLGVQTTLERVAYWRGKDTEVNPEEPRGNRII